MPPYVVWKPTSLDYLEWAREQVGDDALLFEPRHQSWFAEDVRDELLRLLEERKMTWVVVDAPQTDGKNVPDTLVATTTPIAYVRFHGRNAATWNVRGGGASHRFDYLYGEDELREWVPPLRELSNEAERGVRVLQQQQPDERRRAGAGRRVPLAQAARRGEGADRMMRILAVTHGPDAGPELFGEVVAEPATSWSSGTSARTARRRTRPTR